MSENQKWSGTENADSWKVYGPNIGIGSLSRKDRIMNEHIRGSVGVIDIGDNTREHRLRKFDDGKRRRK